MKRVATLVLFWLSLCLLAPATHAQESWAPLYDLNGNVIDIAITTDSTTFNLGYTYDVFDQLKTESNPNQTFGYDANGNRKSDAQNTITYVPNSNRIQTLNGFSVVYDNAGNLTDDGTRLYTYNSAGRLKEVKDKATNTVLALYTYNYQGQRIQKVTTQGITIYHYDLDGNLIDECTITGQTQKEYIYRDNVPITQIDTSTATDKIAYLHTDHLGTPRTATDASKTTIWRNSTDAFGSALANEDPDSDGTPTTVNLRFPGQYYDNETGLHYNWNRYYDPKTGRYLTSDPIGLEGGLNTYAYVGNNPLYWVDTNGLVNVAPEFSTGGPNHIDSRAFEGSDLRNVSPGVFLAKTVGGIVGAPLATGIVIEVVPVAAIASARACGRVIVQNKDVVRKAACTVGFAAACAQGNLNKLENIRDDLRMLEATKKLQQTRQQTTHLPK